MALLNFHKAFLHACTLVSHIQCIYIHVHTYMICTCGGEGGDTPTGVALHLGTLCSQQKDEWSKSSRTHNGVLVCSWGGGSRKVGQRERGRRKVNY